MLTFEWAIEDVFAAYPALSLEHAAAMAVALMRIDEAPCHFAVQVDGLAIDSLEEESQFILKVCWSPETEASAERMERTEQRTPMVERAAIAMAALLLSHFLLDRDMEVMNQTDRADYWLPNKRLAAARS